MKQVLTVAFAMLFSAAAANGAMEVYDDFSGTELDAGKWVVSGTPIVSGGEVILNQDNAGSSVTSTATWALPANDGDKLTIEYAIRLPEGFVWYHWAASYIIGYDLIDSANYGGIDCASKNSGDFYKAVGPDGTEEWTTMDRPGYDTSEGGGGPDANDHTWDLFRLEYEKVAGEFNYRAYGKHAGDADYVLLREMLNYSQTRQIVAFQAQNATHNIAVDYVQTEFIPEPATLCLLALGAVAALARKR